VTKIHNRIAQVQKLGVGANSAQLSFTGTELYRFELSIGCNAKILQVLNGCYGNRGR